MIDTIKRTPGDFCWFDLATPSLQGSKQFYQALFSWHYETNELPGGMTYDMASLDGHEFLGMYQMTEEMMADGFPASWASYILTANVDQTLEKASSLGATVLAGPFDVTDVGRMGVVQDPTGAVISFWQSTKIDIDQPGPATHGVCSWRELLTDDLDKAKQFYQSLLGWEYQEGEYNGKQYLEIKHEGRPIAGMYQKPADLQAPNHWMVYFTTSNIKETLEKAKAEQATPLFDPMSIDGVGQICTLKDPQGVYFSLVEYDPSLFASKE